jgi:two-component system sensor histidine kinase KdpD
VLADGALLERVVANLVGNAVKHTDSMIELEVGRADPPLGNEDGTGPRTAGIHAGSAVDSETAPEAGPAVVRLRVVDHGPGIPAEHWDRVFRPFQRLGDRDNTAGVGLGLALARGLVEAMNGELRPEETPGGGLTMVVDLPAAPHGPDPARVAEEESGP